MQSVPTSAATDRRFPLAAPLLVLLLSAAPPPKPAPPPASAELARRVEQLADRLRKVESLLGRPFGAELTAGTVLERIARIERDLLEVRRTQPAAGARRSRTSDTETLRRRLDDASRKLDRMQREMQRTLDDLRRELRAAQRVHDQLRELHRAIDRLQRGLDSLERRVDRLERP